MVWVAGVDGCPKGWFRACRETESGELHFGVVERVEGLGRLEPRPEWIAIDIPIGLPDAGSRACDLAARKVLGVRRNSVFPAPIRPALRASSRVEASEITQSVDGRKVSAQAWGLYPKIREVDDWVRVRPGARERTREVHPEVSFTMWNGGRPMSAPKKKREGRATREALVEAWLGPDLLSRARHGERIQDLAHDDILDAVAALWSATRFAAGQGETLPADPPRDSAGLQMEIAY